MVDWRSDHELYTRAEQLGIKITQMFENEGGGLPDYAPPNPDGPPSPNPQKEIVESITYDAMDFASLDPQKLAEEYQRMQRAASETGENGTAKDKLDVAMAKVAAVWRGDAADAFAEQLKHVRTFMEQQERHLLVAAQAMGTAFGLSVRVRESYCNLAENTNVACWNVITKQTQDLGPKSSIAMGVEIVKSGIDLFGMEKIKDLKDWAIDKFFDGLSAAVEEEPIDDSGANQVLDSYVRARNQLRQSYEDGLNQLRSWLNDHHWIYIREPIPLLEPLPAYADIDSPDFRYEHFSNNYHDPATYSPRVEAERKRYVEEKNDPPGVIGQRLSGEE